MDILTNIIAGVTALDIYYADLPDTAHSYDGEARDISRFYDQDIPNFYIAGNYAIDDNDYISWSLDTGTHTEKLNTGSISAEWTHIIPINDNWSASGTIGADISFNNHSPCTDSYNREYLCSNLTAWSDFERNHNEQEIDPKIRVSITRRW